MKKRALAIEIISALFILLFVYTAVSKWLDWENFRYVLSKSPFIGTNAGWVTWALPALELIIAAMLFVPRTRLWGLYSSFGIMTAFTLYIAYMLAFTPDRPCSCGGVLQSMTWNQHLIFNIFFTLLAALGIWLYKKKAKQEHLLMRQQAMPV